MKNPGKKNPMQVTLIFNPTAGKTDKSPKQLVQILVEMQKHNLQPEVHVWDSAEGMKAAVKRALKDGTRLVVASGGDGTIDSVAAELAGTHLTLGILPTGTANNLAINLRIPRNLDEAVAVLREGRRIKIDMGRVRAGGVKQNFLEMATLGLVSDIFPPADDFRRGELLKAGEVISTFADASPSLVTLEMDNKKPVGLSAFSVVVANMPYIARHFRINRTVSFRDGKLNVFVFTELSKVGLLNYAIRYLSGEINDETVKHFRVQRVKITTHPPMGANADGQPLRSGPLYIKVQPAALRVMANTVKGTGPSRSQVPKLIKEENG
jgi:diacylglycerol kinase (ATP)